MTGFARAAVTVESGAQLVCEIRSVNGKSLDVRLRLPNGMDRIELPARQLTQAKIGRGNLQINVALEAGLNIDDLGGGNATKVRANQLSMRAGTLIGDADLLNVPNSNARAVELEARTAPELQSQAGDFSHHKCFGH